MSDKEYLLALVEYAQGVYGHLKDAGFFDSLSEDERAGAIQAFPDGPLSAHAWHVWLNAIDDDGFEAAWGRRPWSYVGSQAAEVMT